MEMYEGPDRIEFSPLLGRPIRMGSWSELSVSDRQRVLQALEAEDVERFTAYWSYFHFGLQLMAGLALEWGRAWQAEIEEPAHQSALAAVRATAAEAERAVDSSAERLALPPTEMAIELAGQAHWAAAREQVLQTWSQARGWHDFWFRYSWAVMSQLLEQQGQTYTEEAIQRVLSRTSFYEPSWQQTAGLTQEQLAVMLAEHLRLHFSGAEGEVEICDEGHQIRLHLNPCGSGGRMRQQAVGSAEFKAMPQATSLTWGKAAEVPAYCAHCAFNEQESLRRLGSVRWVTDFQTDPQRACGWILPKSLPG